MIKELLRRIKNSLNHLVSGEEIAVQEESPFLCPCCKKPSMGICMSCKTRHKHLHECGYDHKKMTYQEQLDTWVEIMADRYGEKTSEKPYVPSVVSNREG